MLHDDRPCHALSQPTMHHWLLCLQLSFLDTLMTVAHGLVLFLVYGTKRNHTRPVAQALRRGLKVVARWVARHDRQTTFGFCPLDHLAILRYLRHLSNCSRGYNALKPRQEHVVALPLEEQDESVRQAYYLCV